MREIRNAICDINSSDEVKEDTRVIFNLAIKLIIDPFDKVFVPDIEIETKYDFRSWVLDGYSKRLGSYKFDKHRKITLKCRNPHAVNKTIEKDQEQKRTDCFHFFRYMNSGLMRRYIDSQEQITLIKPQQHLQLQNLLRRFVDVGTLNLPQCGRGNTAKKTHRN